MDKQVFRSVAGEIFPQRGTSSGVFNHSQPWASLLPAGQELGAYHAPTDGRWDQSNVS